MTAAEIYLEKCARESVESRLRLTEPVVCVGAEDGAVAFGLLARLRPAMRREAEARRERRCVWNMLAASGRRGGV